MTTPLTAGRPGTSESGAAALASRHWRLEPARVRELPSDRDRNFLVEDASGERRVLKVFNLQEDPAVVDLQDRALEHVAARDPGLALPRVLPTREGERVARVPASGGAAGGGATPPGPGTAGAGDGEALLRLTTWVPGRPLAEVRPHTEDLLEGAGRFLGRLAGALEDFTHPAADRAFPWDLRHGISEVERRLEGIPDAEGRRLLSRHLDLLAPRLEPLGPRLPAGVVHGDANDHNLLVSPTPETGRGPAPPLAPAVTGIIDFGDMLRSWRVAEPAVAAAYALLGKEDPLGAAGRVLAGYHAVRGLEDVELEAAHPLVVLRLLLSLSIGAEQTAREPQHPYLAVSREPAWQALARLDGESHRLAHVTYRHACGRPPCREAAPVVRWLRGHGAEAAPVIPESLRREIRVMEPGEPDPGARGPPADAPGAWDAGSPQEREGPGDGAAGAAARRWNEVRPHRGRGGSPEPRTDGSEPRTVHLGVDLLLPPGTPLHAPLAGRVHDARTAPPEETNGGPTLVLEHRGTETGGQEPVTFYTLFRHVDPDALRELRDRSSPTVERGEPVARAPAGSEAPVPVRFQVAVDDLGLGAALPATAPPDRRELWKALLPDPNLLLRIPGLEPAPDGPSADGLLARRRRLLGPGLSVAYRKPLVLVRGWRQWLYDAEGREYLDCVNNVPHVGHAHPRVVEALARQAAALNTNTRYLHERILEYAEHLAATLPDPLSVCFLVNSGSEANELALRLAEARTGARDVVVLEGGYHGNTSGLVDISPYKFQGPGGRSAPPWVHPVPMPDPYRGRYRPPRPGIPAGDPGSGSRVASEGEAAARYAEHVQEAVEAARERGGVRALFAEPVLSCGGQVVPPRGFLAAAHEAVRRAGGLLVSDEVQVGLGRLGRAFWGFELEGVTPDIVTMGKPLGNGHPLGAVVTTPEVAEAFHTGMEYFNTFGGNPVSCAVGLAVLEVMEEEGLQDHALRVGDRLRKGLVELGERHPLVGDARGEGLFLGLELVRDRSTREPATAEAAYLKERMRERGILLSTDGPDENVVKMKPPLPFSPADADRVVETLDELLAEDALRR